MDSELEYATLGRVRVGAQQSLEAFKSSRHQPQRTLDEATRRLEQVEREIKQELFNLAMSRLSRAEAPRVHPEYTVGLGGILTGGGMGELIGRDYTG